MFHFSKWESVVTCLHLRRDQSFCHLSSINELVWKFVFNLYSLSTAASCGGGLRPQWCRPGRWLWQGWIMSPNGDRIRSRLVWSGLILCDPPPLSCGRMGGPVVQLLKYSRKDTRDTCRFSHHLCQSQGTGGEGECRVPGVNCASHTCWTLEAAYFYCHHQLRRGGRRFWMWHFSCSFKSFVPLSRLQPPSSTIFKMWTC